MVTKTMWNYTINNEFFSRSDRQRYRNECKQGGSMQQKEWKNGNYERIKNERLGRN